MSVWIREATGDDRGAISDLIMRAFGPAEGVEIVPLVEALERDPTARPRLSLVAFEGDRLVGHVLFTRVGIEGARPTVPCSLLAPLSVVPDRQGQGIGGRLVEAGLDRLAESGVALVFVLGHPGYYPRCGFQPAVVEGFGTPYPILPENVPAWMVQELRPGTLGKVRGRVTCARALDDPAYWQE